MESIMGSLSLVCPMCCGESFDNSRSLKYHLLSMTDNLYCPSCSQRSDSVTALIRHLDKCEQDFEHKAKSDILMDNLRKVGQHDTQTNASSEVRANQINRSFLATMSDSGIVIVGDPQTIQVDVNGEIKVVEKMDTEELQTDEHSLDFKMSEELPGINVGTLRGSQSSQGLAVAAVSAPTANLEHKTAPMEKSMIAVLPGDSEFLDADAATLIDMDRINETDGIDEASLLRVKRELCELEPDAVYSCTSCEMSFNSVLEHIKQFHDGQEVLLEMAEQLDDSGTMMPASQAQSAIPQLVTENVVNARQRQTMNTLRTEECVDSEGRLYTRKVVQIEKFWDRVPIQVTTQSQSTKAPMIEKFFSNVEGVKARLCQNRTRMHTWRYILAIRSRVPSVTESLIPRIVWRCTRRYTSSWHLRNRLLRLLRFQLHPLEKQR